MASFVDRSIGFKVSFNLTRMNIELTDIVNKVVVDRKEIGREERELSKLQSETEEVERVF